MAFRIVVSAAKVISILTKDALYSDAIVPTTSVQLQSLHNEPKSFAPWARLRDFWLALPSGVTVVLISDCASLRLKVYTKLQKLETGLRPNTSGIPYTLVLRIEAIGFPTFGLLL